MDEIGYIFKLKFSEIFENTIFHENEYIKNDENKILIICVNNVSFDHKVFNSIKNILHRLKYFIILNNYEKICIIRTHPSIDCKIFDTESLYTEFNFTCNSLLFGELIDKITHRDLRIDMLKMCIKMIKEHNGKLKNTDVIIFSHFLHSDSDFYNELNEISAIANLYYVYFFNGKLAILPNHIKTIFINKNELEYCITNKLFDMISNKNQFIEINFDEEIKIAFSQANINLIKAPITNQMYGLYIKKIDDISNENIVVVSLSLLFGVNNHVETKFISLSHYKVSAEIKYNHMDSLHKVTEKLMHYDLLLEYIEEKINLEITDNVNQSNYVDYKNCKLMYDLIKKQLRIINLAINSNDMHIVSKREIKIMIDTLIKRNRIINIYLQTIQIRNKNNSLANDDISGLFSLIEKYIKNSELNIKNNAIKSHVAKNILSNYEIIHKKKESIKNVIIHLENNINILSNEINTNNKLVDSQAFYASIITLSSWVDELQNHNSMGILIDMKSNELSKIGANGNKPLIMDITNTFIPIKDYLEIAIDLVNKCYQGTKDIDHLHNNYGNVVGNGNIVIPIYININHWKIARIHLEYILGMALANNPLSFFDNHLNFMFYMLSDMTRMIFSEDINDRTIRTYMSLYRTCAEIAYEKSYHKGIKKMITNLLSSPERIMISRPFDNDVLFGQILATGSNISNNDLVKLCDKIYDNIFWKNVSKNYSDSYFTDVFIPLVRENANDKIEQIENELDLIIKFIESKILQETETICHNYSMIQFMKIIIQKNNGFTKLLKKLDDNYGVLDDENVNHIKNLIKNKIKNNHVINTELLYEKFLHKNYKIISKEYVLRSLMYDKLSLRKAFYNTDQVEINNNMSTKDVLKKYSYT